VVLDVLAQCARADVGRFAGRTKQAAGNEMSALGH
jgi:hypothetical protein